MLLVPRGTELIFTPGSRSDQIRSIVLKIVQIIIKIIIKIIIFFTNLSMDLFSLTSTTTIIFQTDVIYIFGRCFFPTCIQIRAEQKTANTFNWFSLTKRKQKPLVFFPTCHLSKKSISLPTQISELTLTLSSRVDMHSWNRSFILNKLKYFWKTMKIWTASLDILTKMGQKYSVINSVDRKSVISTVITFRILGSNAVFKDCLSSKPKNLKCYI